MNPISVSEVFPYGHDHVHHLPGRGRLFLSWLGCSKMDPRSGLRAA